MGNGECSIRLTVATKVSDQDVMGPRGVPAQSKARIRPAISPVPWISFAICEKRFSWRPGTIGDPDIAVGPLIDLPAGGYREYCVLPN